MPKFLIAVTVATCVVGGPLRGRPAFSATTAQQSAANLDELLAPVALYPDSLLAQMLMSAANPGKIAELDKWLTSNQTLKGTALQDAAVKAGFEPSFVALVLFPQVVTYMATQSAWTEKVGAAFLLDKNAVFASIQKLRQQAKEVGNLKSTAQQQVETKTTSSGQEVIVIEPANPQIVYVPQYNTQVVYTQPATQTIVVQEDNTAEAVAAGMIGFTAGIAIGAAMDNNYYYGPYGYRGGGVYMYNDAWDDYYDARDDAREYWQDHREDLVEERDDRAGTRQEQRTDRQQTSQQQRTERQQTRSENAPARSQPATSTAGTSGGTSQRAAGRTGSTQARGYSDGTRTDSVQRGTTTDAFSGYANGRSERASSARGQSSRASAR